MRQVVTVFFLITFGLLMIAFPLVHSSLATLGDASIYREILQSKEFKQEISKRVSFGGRLLRIAQIDKKLYYSILNYVKRKITNKYIPEIFKRWIAFIHGSTAEFDPIINIKSLKNVIYYRVMKRIKQKYALYPVILKKSIIKEAIRRFSRFPSEINMFSKFKLSKKDISIINRAGNYFSDGYNLRLLFLLIPFLLLGLGLLLSKKRLLMLDIGCFIGIGITVALLILSFVFKGFIINLSYNSVSYVGVSMQKVKPYLDMFWDGFFTNLKTVSFTLLLPFLIVIVGQLFVKDKKSEG